MGSVASFSGTSSQTYPLEHREHHFEDLDDGSEDPDVEDGGEGEDDGPEDGEREDEEGGEDPVEPELGLTEQDEGQSPERIEPVGRGRFCQHVREVELREVIMRN